MGNLFNFKSFFKALAKNQLYTFIEIFGLSLSLMFVILIAVYTTQELSTDNFQQNKDQLYFVASEESFGQAYALANMLKDRYPEIEEACPMVNYFKKAAANIQDRKLNADLMFAGPNMFKMTSFDIVKGERENPLAAKNEVVISETFAKKAFPHTDPLGQSIQMHDSVTVIVTAVVQDIENSVIPYADIILRIDNIGYWNKGLASPTMDNYGMAPVLIQAKPGTDLIAKEADLLEFMKEVAWPYKEGVNTAVSFIPIKEVYFSTISGHRGHLLNQGNKTFVLILLSVGILILVFAIINYINLAVAQTGFRAKEMATRRLLGSSREELFTRLIMESTLLTFISFIIGVILAFIMLPYANNLLETRLDLVGMISPITILIVLVILIIIGGVAGLLPAIVISNAKPVEVVKGSFRQKTKMVFSKFFITFQNIITIALVTASLVMVIQTRHLIKAPLGYNTTNIIDIDLRTVGNKQSMLTLKNEFSNLASVQRISFSQGLPFTTGNNYTYSFKGRPISFQAFVGDSAFVPMLGLEILRDNQVASGDAFYLSERAMRELELTDDTQSFTLEPFFGGSLQIAGIMKDVQLGNIMYGSRPTLWRIKKIDEFIPWNMAVEITGNPVETYNELKNIFEKITSLEFTGKFIDQQVAESFRQQVKTSRIVTIFAGIAILLSFLGLVAMSTYFIQQRSREIAVRKVFGSTNEEMLKRLVFTFLNYVGIAFVIVTPIIWYIMKQWLDGYSYRISLSPWIFIAGGLFCLILSFITVFWQSYQAANANPVSNLKTE